MLPLVIQIGAVQIEPVTPRLLRVRPGSDEPSVLGAIRHAGGSLDGTRRFFWVDAFKLRQLEAELRAEADPLFHILQSECCTQIFARGRKRPEEL